MKKLLFMFVLLLSSIGMSAQSFIINNDDVNAGMIFTITSTTNMTVELTEFDSGGFIDLDLPERVKNNNDNNWYTITSIGEGAFRNTLIYSIIIPNTVTSIGVSAFESSHLTSIEIGDGVTSIGEKAFYKCDQLTGELIIPDNVTNIGKSAFCECRNLTSVDIGYGVTSIGENAFYMCNGLTAVEFGYSLTSIGAEAFAFCTGLTSVTIPFSVTSLGRYAFMYCSNLTSVTIEDCWPLVFENGVFDLCDNLTSVTIEMDIPPSINVTVFPNCANATLYVPSGCIDTYAAANYWKDFKSIVVDGENIVLENVVAGTLSTLIPIKKYNVVKNLSISGAINASDFAIISQLTKLETLNVTADITGGIPAKAFQNHQHLKSVSFTGSCNNIGQYAFQGCTSLTSLTIGNSVTSIGSCAFQGCTSLTSLTIGNSVTSIGGSAFYCCSGLTSVTIPNSVTSIGGSAFYCCRSLTSLTIGNSVTSIGGWAFRGCTSLTSVNIPNSVTSIGQSAFYGCTSLTSITIPNSVTSIRQSAFEGTAWYNNQPDGMVYAGRVAYKYKGEMPSNTSITLNDGTMSITGYAFSGCSGLTSVTIPNSVTSIGEDAFSDCSRLTSVYCYMETPPTITEDVFTNRANATLYVPAGSKAAYEAADYWKEFKEIVEMEEDVALTLDMFHEWDGCTATPTVVNENTEGTINLNETLYGQSLIYGNENVFYTHYADLTDYESLTVEGTPGLQLRMILNRQEPVEGGDPHGGSYIELLNTIDDNGKAVFSFADYPYVHLNALKLHGEGSSGTITSLTLKKGSSNIIFADAKVKAICVENWDTNGDGELSKAEAAAVTSLGDTFTNNKEITSFDELRYFTGLTELHQWGSSVDGCSFDGCNALKSITIPANVTMLYGASFGSCTLLQQISVDPANTKYEAPTGCNAIIEKATNKLVVGCETTQIPYGITTIGNDAFGGRWGMQRMDIPETVTTIEGYAFVWCTSLRTITLPASINAIGDEAFNYCNNLTSVYSYMETPPTITKDVFSNRANATLYVPAGTKAAYEAADYWKEFKEIVEWVNIIANSDLEGENLSCFFSRDNYFENEGIVPTTIVEGAGVNGSRGIVIQSVDNPSEAWATQFFIRLPQTLPAGTKYRISFDCKASQTATCSTEVHQEPGDYIHWIAIGNVNFASDWQHFESTGVISDEQSPADKPMRTIAFNLTGTTTSTTYYFDNIVFETIIDGTEAATGDLNGDGEVNVMDIMEVIDLMVAESYNANADLNGDNVVDVMDIMEIIDLMIAQAGAQGARAAMARTAIGMENSDYITAAISGKKLNIGLENVKDYSAFQMTVTVPDGMTLNDISLNTNRSNKHSVSIQQTASNQYLVIGYSMDNRALKGNTVELLSIGYEGAATGGILIGDVLFGTTAHESCRLGDAMVDGTVTGISEIEGMRNGHKEVFYDLQGRKVNSQLKKGLYISEGKKISVK